MSKLEEIYQSIDTLKKYGVKINKEQLQAFDEFEEKLIKEEVLPALSQDIAPRLNPIKRNLVIVVEYSPGQPINVALSRKVRISDFSDAKSLTPMSLPVSSDEKPKQKVDKSGRRVKNHTKGMKVTFADGTVVWHRKAIDTYIDTIKRIGYERVSSLGIKHGEYNIVSRQPRPTEHGRIWQHEIDGWYIWTNSSNLQKSNDLKQISDHYSLGLTIEEGKLSEQ